MALAAVVVAMAVDHLVGTDGADDDGGFPVDPWMFAIAVLVSLAAAALLFGWIVPRARAAGPERAARTGLVLGILGVLPGIAFLWIGFPLVVAGAGVDLGLDGRRGRRRAEATVAVVLGALLLAGGVVAYLVAAVV